jgi:TolB-like protein
VLSVLVMSSVLAAGGAKMAVLSFTASGVDATVASSVTESVTAEIAVRGYFDPISASEIQSLLGAERQKQLLGCGEESCITELAGALGAPYLMSGSLVRLEGVFQLNVQVLDSAKARIIGRSTKVSKDFESLRFLIPYAVAEACGTPLPAPPSRVLPYSMIAVGGAAVIGGGVLGIVALNNESVLRGELGADDKNHTVVLNTATFYKGRLTEVAAQKSVALTGLIVGAALVGAGLFLIPPAAPEAGVKVALVPVPFPGGVGVALVGVLP